MPVFCFIIFTVNTHYMEKIILVTGATSGFGKAIATRFAKEGYIVCITGRREDRLAGLKTDLEKQYGVRVVTLAFDIRDRSQVENALNQLKTQVSHIDILVNNAGLASGLATIDEGDIDDWETMIDTNLKGLLYVTRQITPMMRLRAHYKHRLHCWQNSV